MDLEEEKKQFNINLYLRIPLQFFADSDEKTEEPTQKRKQDARKKGQVFKSTELNSAVVLLAVFVCLKTFGLSLYAKMVELMNLTFEVYMIKYDLFFVKFYIPTARFCKRKQAVDHLTKLSCSCRYHVYIVPHYIT